MDFDSAPSVRPTRRRLLAACLCAAVPAARAGLPPAAYVARVWPADKPTPPLGLSDLHGKTWDLAAFRGRPVVLNFWATWCEPCRAEMPSLQKLANAYRHDGLAVLSINYQEALPTIRRFLDAVPMMSLPVLLDHDGAATAAWTPRVFPTTVLVDRSGAARQQVIGELDWAGPLAAELLRPLLARAKPG